MQTSTQGFDWVALASFITAVLALVVGVWSMLWTRRKDILSVRPRLCIFQEFTDRVCELRLVNLGAGPAEIVRFEYVIGGTPTESIFKALESSGIQELERSLIECRSFLPGYFIGKESENPLVRIDPQSVTDGNSMRDHGNRIIGLLKRIEIHIDFKCSYNTKQPLYVWNFKDHG